MALSKKAQNKVLFGLVILLSITFIFSFAGRIEGNKKRKALKTALMNPKYKDSIQEFNLTNGEEGFTFLNQDGCWLFYDIKNPENKIPADPKKMENFINELIKVRNLCKISYKISEENAYGLTNDQSFHIKYTVLSGDKPETTDLVFGNSDFSHSFRYFMNAKTTTVYEIDSSIQNYLSTNYASWAEPYLISKVLSNKIDESVMRISGHINKTPFVLNKSNQSFTESVDKLLALRHSGFADINPYDFNKIDSLEACLEAKIEGGDTSVYSLKIYKAQSEDNYIVLVNYQPFLKNKNYTCALKISSWTYNTIVEKLSL